MEWTEMGKIECAENAYKENDTFTYLIHFVVNEKS